MKIRDAYLLSSVNPTPLFSPGPPTQVKQSVERQSVLGKAAVVDWMVVVHPNAQDRRRENRTGLPWRKTQDDGHVTI